MQELDHFAFGLIKAAETVEPLEASINVEAPTVEELVTVQPANGATAPIVCDEAANQLLPFIFNYFILLFSEKL
ncbi:hypothetical protein [Acinetobacter gyllenbergii]|uniref:hypothetical protein n=1 Tax=Acinetobacter gyllenbergii TaxID=134534 RepID=UPI003F562EE5